MAARRKKKKKNTDNTVIRDNLILIGTGLLCLLLLLSQFGMGASVGGAIKTFMHGMFGLCAYLFPIALFAMVLYNYISDGLGIIKTVCCVLCFWLVCFLVEMICGQYTHSNTIVNAWNYGVATGLGGGAFGGILSLLIRNPLGLAWAVLIDLAGAIICFVVITEKSFIHLIGRGSKKAYGSAKKDMSRRREKAVKRRDDRRKAQEEYEEEYDKEPTEKPLRRIDRKAEGVTFNTDLRNREDPANAGNPASGVSAEAVIAQGRADDMREIVLPTADEPGPPLSHSISASESEVE